MSTYVDSAAVGGPEDIPDLTTAGVTTTGTDTLFIGGGLAGSFGGAIDTTAMRYGGSGGTLLTQAGTDQAVGGLALASLNAWRIVNPATSSQTAYGLFSNALTQMSCVLGACYSGVDQTTPIGTPQQGTGSDGSGSITSLACSITATGLTIGKRLVAIVGAFSTGVDITSYTAISGQGTLRDHAISVLAGTAIAIVDKVVASTSESIGAQVNITATGAQIDYAIIAFEINDAAGGGGGVALMGQKIFVRP